jgi:hypothetical protein
MLAAGFCGAGVGAIWGAAFHNAGTIAAWLGIGAAIFVLMIPAAWGVFARAVVPLVVIGGIVWLVR